MPGDRTTRQIRDARAELKQLNRELDRFADKAQQAGNKGGQSFGQRFKRGALSGLKEMAKGAAFQLGATLVERFFKAGEAGGRGFGRGFKRAAKKEIDAAGATLAPAGGGAMNAGLWKGVAIGAAVVGLAAGKTLVDSIREAMGQEQLTMSLDALTGGAGGGRVFEALRTDALRTGVEIEGMADNVRKFLAMGFDEGAALKLNRAILDVAGGMGLTTEDAKLLGMALSQVAAKGVASMEELRGQIAERGVPVFELLAGKLGVTQAELFKLIAAGKVSAATLIESFSNLEGPLAKFAGGAERLGKTGGGLFSRLKQEWIDLKRVFGEQVLPEIKPILEDGITLLAGWKEQAKQFGEQIAESLGWARAAMQELSFGEIFKLAGLQLKEAFLSALDLLARGMVALFRAFQDPDFMPGLEQRMREAGQIFKAEMLRAVANVYSMLGEGLDSDSMRAMSLGAGALAAETDRQRRANAQSQADPIAIFRAEFDKVASMFGLTDQDRAEMSGLIDRVNSRRAENVANPPPEDPAPAPTGSATPPAGRAAFDPRAVIGGGIANALSAIGGGGSTVILQRQVDLAQQTNRKIDDTNRKLDEIARNTKPVTPRGPIAARQKFT